MLRPWALALLVCGSVADSLSEAWTRGYCPLLGVVVSSCIMYLFILKNLILMNLYGNLYHNPCLQDPKPHINCTQPCYLGEKSASLEIVLTAGCRDNVVLKMWFYLFV